MALLFNAGRFKATDKANQPIGGAFLAFYSTLTSSFQPIYTDSTLSAFLSNPVQADTNGLFPEIWLDDSLDPYKVVFSSPDVNNITIPGSVIWTILKYNESLSGDAVAQRINPRTDAEKNANVTPLSYSYSSSPQADAFRYLDATQIGLILNGQGSTQNAGAITVGLQNALNVSFAQLWQAGNYALVTTLALRPRTFLGGSGKADYVSTLDDPVHGTRLIQTSAVFAISTNIGTAADSLPGNVVIENLTVLGGTVTSPIGTYGVVINSSDQAILRNVQASFFTLSGFHFVGSLLPHIVDCECTYNQQYGLALDYGNHGTTELANSYVTKIEGGKYTQNGNGGILIGVSSVRVSIWGIDCESNGRFYPSGLGYGIWIGGEARVIDIDGCWFEDNKTHIVVGDNVAAPSLVTIPQAVRIANCEFGGINGTGGPAIYFNAGRDLLVENCEFSTAANIQLSNFVDNPVFRNIKGNPNVIDEDGTLITVDSRDLTNNFTSTDLTGWTLTNCAVVAVNVSSPAGPLPVYKVTPTTTGLVQLASPNSPYSFWMKRQTIGCYMRTDATVPLNFWPRIASANMPKVYTALETDIWEVTSKWAWQSIGRKIATTDTGNQEFSFVTTVTTTDPFYISAFVSLNGIVYQPYMFPRGLLSTVVYGTTVIPDCTQGDEFVITATNGTAFTVAAPTSPAVGRIVVITIRNTSGGALGTATWNGVYKMSSWTQPANGNSRSITFRYDGTNWVQVSQTGADIPN